LIPGIYEVDPLEDQRWPEFLQRHPDASVFHSPQWLRTIHRTYGYVPAVLTTSRPNQDLTNGLVFCRVRTWLTGRRLVSLPFSDHCQPLVSSPADLDQILRGFEILTRSEGCRYSELRPTSTLAGSPHWRADQLFYLHRVDLRPGAEAILRHCHYDCIQRRIRRAEKAGLTVTEGRTGKFLRVFYDLALETRRRQGLPPQPVAWFENLLNAMGDSATIRCAFNAGNAIAAILTLEYGKRMYYKYGASLPRFHQLGAVPLLLWRAIQGAARLGYNELDLGRSDHGDAGLVKFKERWNAESQLTSYVRHPADAPHSAANRAWLRSIMRAAFRPMPASCLTVLGNISYRHMA
jgi:hypothetical protein